MFHAAKEDRCILMLESREGAAQGIFGPALGISLDLIFKEAVKSGEQFGDQFMQLKLANEIGGFADDEVIAVSESFAQPFDAGFGCLLTEFVQGSELLLELAFSGHRGECNAECAGGVLESGVRRGQKGV